MTCVTFIIVFNRLLNLVLSACKDYLKHSHRKNEQLRHSILKLLKYFWGLWKNAQQQAQIKAMEAESLYKIKEHEIQKFDDDNDDKLLKEQFPSYDYLFSDEAVVEQTSSVLSDSGQSESVALHDADIVSVCALHMLLHGRETLPQSDYSQSPAIQLYEVCSLLHSRLGLIPGGVLYLIIVLLLSIPLPQDLEQTFFFMVPTSECLHYERVWS